MRTSRQPIATLDPQCSSSTSPLSEQQQQQEQLLPPPALIIGGRQQHTMRHRISFDPNIQANYKKKFLFSFHF